MSQKREMRLVGALVALALVQLLVSVQSAPIDAVKGAVKTIASKTADAADKTEPAEETGGVRATALHAGANLVVGKGLDLLGKKYPAVALVAPHLQKLSKPLMKRMHEKINTIGQKKEEEVTTTAAPAEALQEPKESDKKPAQADEKNKKVKAEEKVKVEDSEEKKGKDKKEEGPKKEETAEKEVEKSTGQKKKVEKEDAKEALKAEEAKTAEKVEKVEEEVENPSSDKKEEKVEKADGKTEEKSEDEKKSAEEKKEKKGKKEKKDEKVSNAGKKKA